jgi:membrane-associated phospholipid phosphatase
MLKGGVYEQGHEVVGVNNSAAFPSYHTAHTALVAVVIWWYAPRWRHLGVLYLASMCFALVYLGEHYVADEVAGILIAAVAWAVALRVTPKALSRPAAEPIAVLQPAEERQAA